MATATTDGVTEIALATDLFELVDNGSKRATVRKGHRDYATGAALLTDRAEETRPIELTGVRHCRFSDLSCDDALRDGFASLDELRATLERFYPGFGVDDEVTVVSFELA